MTTSSASVFPVRWVEPIESMVASGVSSVLEEGPGQVLMGLARRIDGNLNGLAVHDPDSLTLALEALDES